MELSFWRFLDTSMAQGETLAVSYNPLLVVLSFAVATLAGYTALRVQERMSAAPSSQNRLVWLGLGAVAMGAGIWAMHFIGMLSFSIPAPVSYSLPVTVASLLPGVFASAVALHFLDRPRITGGQAALGGLLMALGIGGMHFLGMEAMRMDVHMAYLPILFVLSIVVAFLLAAGALFVHFEMASGRTGGSRLQIAASAALLGGAIGGMHYTAMASARFFPEGGVAAPSFVIPSLWLAVAVSLVSCAILGLAIVSTFVDRHLAKVSTSLSRVQERARHIIDTSPEAIITAHEDGTIVDWNEQAELTFGWKTAEAVGSKFVDLIVPERHRADHLAGVDRFLTDPVRRKSSSRLEIEALHRDGTEFPVEISVSALDREGECLLVAFLHDISERIEARRALEQATEQAKEAALAKGQFLANMSHEIRTPMNGVIGMTQLLLGTDLTPEQREQAEIVQMSAESLLTVINDILDFSKVEAGKIELETIDFDVRVTVEEVTTMLAQKADESGLELMCSVNANVPDVVGGDPARLRQILTNLLTNAIKFTSEGEVVVTVEVEREGPDDVVLAFEVTDTGIGIPEDRLEAIFQAFDQADSTTTRKYGGTGLGLAIVSRLVEVMGGEIQVKSVVGEGSAFAFSVPLERRSAQQGPPRTVSTASRVLIVDDNETNRKILHAQLASFGIDHVAVEGGEAALVLLRAAVEEGNPFEVALLDFHMPGMDGAELGRLIKADGDLESTKLVLLTSAGNRGDAARFTELGFAAYLVKPVRQSDLFDCLVTVLNQESGEEFLPKPPLITRHTLSETRRRDDITILLAEDNRVNQMVTLALLKKLGYACDVVADGEQAISAVRTGRYRVVLMDCQMPVLDGFEATRQIRKLEGEGGSGRLPIVALTANAMAGDRERCIEAGMDDYLSKPIDPEEFKRVVRRALLRDATRPNEERVELESEE